MAAPLTPPISTETLFTVRLETWRRFFDAHGAPELLIGSLATVADVDDFVVRGVFTDAVLDQLAFIEAFATEKAREAIYEAAAAFDYRGAWRDCVSPADLAATCSAQLSTDAPLRRVVAAARTRVARWFTARTWLCFVGRKKLAIGDPAQYAAAIEAELDAWARATDRGPWVRVRAGGTSRKARFELAHEDRASGTSVIADAALALGVSRPIRSHLVTYDGERLYVWTAMPEIALALVERLGRVLADDSDWFFSRGAVSTAPLQRASEEGKLAKHGTTFSSVDFIGGLWDSGDDYSLSPRGVDAFLAFKAHGIRIDGGAVRLATLRGFTAPPIAGPRSADYAIRPPYTATCSEPALAAAFLRFADALGVTAAAPVRSDWFAFAPYKHDLDGWEGLTDLEAVIKAGILVEDAEAPRRIAHPRHRHAGRIATVFDLPGGGKYALSDDPLFPAFLADPAQCVTWSLDFKVLCALLARDLGLSGGSSKADEDGILFLGERDLASTHVRVYLATRACRESAAERLRLESTPGHTVVLVPEGRKIGAGLAHVALRSFAPPYRSLLGDIVRGLRLVDSVAPTLYAPPDARIVLHRKNGVLYVDGLLVARASTKVFRLVDFLSQNLEQLVTSRQIHHYVSGKSTDDAVGRKTIDEFLTAVIESFRDAKKKAPKGLQKFILQDRHGEYRLAVPIFCI